MRKLNIKKLNNKIKIISFFIFFLTIYLINPIKTFAIINVTQKNPIGTGLVGWWTFDGKGTSNGRMLDLSGNNNSLFLKNISTSTFYTSGIIGQGINCDGVDDNLLLTSDPIGTGAVSISMWIKPRSFGTSGLGTMIWGNTTRFRITSSSGNKLEFTSDNFTTSAFSAANSIVLNKWSHIVAVRNSSNQVTLYVNGVVSGTANQSSGTPSGSTVGTICESVTSSNRFDGSVDDIKVYNTALSSSAITKLYDQGIGKNNITPKLPLRSGVVAWWTFDGKDITNGVVNDISGNSKNGNLINISTSTFYTSGKIGQGLNFDGIDDYISLGNVSSSINSISFWIKARNTTKKIMDLNGTQSIESIVGTISANSFTSPTIYVNGAVSSSITANTWYHVVITTNTPINASAVDIGRISSSYFQGILEDVRFYNRVLSITEARQLYNEGNTKVQVSSAKSTLNNGLLAWWSFDGKTIINGRVLDASGNGATAYFNAISTSSVYVAGRIGQGIFLDGIDDFLTTATTVTFPASNQFSLSFWMKTTSPFNSFIGVGYNIFCSFNAKALNCTVDGNSTGGATVSDPSIYSGSWHHIVFVNNGNNQTIYKDGVQAGTATETLVPATNLVRIGNRLSSSSFFRGVIDELRLYGRLLTAAEVLELYNQGR